jgi:hypothetical protein
MSLAQPSITILVEPLRASTPAPAPPQVEPAATAKP